MSNGLLWDQYVRICKQVDGEELIAQFIDDNRYVLQGDRYSDILTIAQAMNRIGRAEEAKEVATRVSVQGYPPIAGIARGLLKAWSRIESA